MPTILAFGITGLLIACLSIQLYNLPLTFWNACIATVQVVVTLALVQCVRTAIGLYLSHTRSESVYNLDHGRLNLELPPVSMWMNMGYWQNTDDFPTACEALLQQVLNTAGLEEPVQLGQPHRMEKYWTLLDLGFGCGDQIPYLHNYSHHMRHYVGLTIDPKQFQYADGLVDHSDELYSLELFLGDAASPESWSDELKQAVENWKTEGGGHKWVLALDTLYHFSPSRWGILEYACKELGASLMAFDLVLAPAVPLSQRLLLRVLTKLMGAPWANFVREDEYRSKLKACGYEEVEIKDVSEHVFGPLADFLDQRDRQLKDIGLGLGKFKAAAWLFRWWATSGIIKGCIVVAKKPSAER